MIKTICIKYSIKKTKLLANGTAPIYLRITIDGERVEFTTRRNIDPLNWNSDAQKMKGASNEAKTLNQYLKSLEQQVYDVHRQMLDERKPITAEGLRDRVTGKAEISKSKMLVPIFKEHNKRVKSLVGKEYAPGTLERYETSLSHTIEFIRWQYHKDDIDIRDIDHQFISSYDYYLRSERNCSNNTVAKYIKNFKKIIRLCMANGWLDKDPFVSYKAKIKEVVRNYLTSDEIQAIAKKRYVSDRLSQVRDVFLFSCFTGLAYADVKKLRRSEITKGIDGQEWIFTSRQKTDTASRIPILPQAAEILDRYVDHPECLYEDKALPVLSNQKMNSYLKEIADGCRINKELTFHIARHTFATSITLANGVSIESVSKMLGHKNIRTTQHYAKILDEKVSEDMSKLKVLLSKFN